MSSEQDQVVATAPLAEARPAAEGTSRRRIVVAPKPVEKPLALISRDPELSEDFEKQLGRARTVVVFPSLTHFCTDPSRMVWGGVVIARSCGWDARLLGFVPSTSSIAFWRVAEEGYGWPSSVSRLDTQEDIVQWLEEIAKPLPFQLSKAEKRAAEAGASPKRAPARRAKPKAQLKFELATVRGVVQEAPLQMELNGLATKRSEPPVSARAPSARAPEGALRLSARAPEGALRPIAASEDEPSARSLRRAPTERPASAPGAARTTRAAQKAAASAQASLDIVAPTPRRGRPPATAKAQDEAVLARDSRALAAKLIGTGRGWSARDESGFMKLAAELGLARAGALLDELRAHAHTLAR